MGWAGTELPDLDAGARARLDALPPRDIPRGTRLFAPGDIARGFAVVLTGRVEVHLTGPSGREILLYAVEPGQSCVQTTLGLLGDAPYTAEALAVTDCRVVSIPAPQFHDLMNQSAPFRGFVFRAFAARMADMTALLERVAFTRVEARLAAALLELAQGDTVQITQADLAARIGTAREVVSRRLDAMARQGQVTTDRGRIHLIDRDALARLATAAV
ncbi:MAG: Crp/Fnr family transcriptional regulator [Gemmobacter sp.]|nr:Crp/Fnr family transcriptional regulator [Gemmobacter sp.]